MPKGEGYMDDNHIPTIVQTKSDADLLKETAQAKRTLMRENNKLKSRIAELEAKNKKYEEALEWIKSFKNCCLTLEERNTESVRIAEQALKG